MGGEGRKGGVSRQGGSMRDGEGGSWQYQHALDPNPISSPFPSLMFFQKNSWRRSKVTSWVKSILPWDKRMKLPLPQGGFHASLLCRIQHTLYWCSCLGGEGLDRNTPVQRPTSQHSSAWRHVCNCWTRATAECRCNTGSQETYKGRTIYSMIRVIPWGEIWKARKHSLKERYFSKKGKEKEHILLCIWRKAQQPHASW